LHHLRKVVASNGTGYNYKVLALTDKDIETEQGKHWGVMGLAFLGGDECVVSTYRLAGSKDRFKKVTLHETGHMLGIDHCKFGVPDCLMNDAKGRGATVDRAKIFLCKSCKKKMKFA
jgi:archaemetzincin